MPVHRGLGMTNRPSWCSVTSAGMFRVARGGRFDRHFHDCDEFWLVFKGRAKILTEGQEYVVGPGDIVCTRAGEEHDVLEVYEDLEAFWFEDALQGQARVGHLHRSPELAEGHLVPGADLPAELAATQ